VEAHSPQSDCAYCFDLTLVIHGSNEADANKALAKLLTEADKIGFDVVWKELEVAEPSGGRHRVR
jgi:hypothetical protein